MMKARWAVGVLSFGTMMFVGEAQSKYENPSHTLFIKFDPTSTLVRQMGEVQDDAIKYERIRVELALFRLKQLDAALDNTLRLDDMNRVTLTDFDGDLSNLPPNVKFMMSEQEEASDYNTISTKSIYAGVWEGEPVTTDALNDKKQGAIDTAEIRIQIRDYFKLKAGLIDLIRGRFNDGFFMTIAQVSPWKNFKYAEEVEKGQFFESPMEYKFIDTTRQLVTEAAIVFMAKEENKGFELRFNRLGSISDRVFSLLPTPETARFLKRLNLAIVSRILMHNNGRDIDGKKLRGEPKIQIRLVGSGQIPDGTLQVYDTASYRPSVTIFLKPQTPGSDALPSLPLSNVNDDSSSGWDKVKEQMHHSISKKLWGRGFRLTELLTDFEMVSWTPGYPFKKPRQRHDKKKPYPIGKTSLIFTNDAPLIAV
eukprot:GHVQ01004986.1.p1 GENE.GHVQ01004986.1~~GHVQ01004986.1.p1  ORF type:complete len:423 (+),score=38.96 GHVQ01004986.1:145-1413(+)